METVFHKLAVSASAIKYAAFFKYRSRGRDIGVSSVTGNDWNFECLASFCLYFEKSICRDLCYSISFTAGVVTLATEKVFTINWDDMLERIKIIIWLFPRLQNYRPEYTADFREQMLTVYICKTNYAYF